MIARLLICAAAVVPAAICPAADRRTEPAVAQPAMLSNTTSQDDFPAIGCAGDGSIWTVWVSWDGGADTVVASRWVDNAWSTPVPLSRNSTDHWRPSADRDGSGQLWAVWSANNQGNWDLWACRLAEGQWSQPRQLTDNAGNDLSQQLVRDSLGTLWVAWQAVVDGNYEILCGRLAKDGLSDVQNVSQHPANDWEPALAADRRGGVYVAWDSYRNDDYDIVVSRLEEGRAAGPVTITASPDYEAHASLAVDSENRLWVAWDNGGPDWGRHGTAKRKLHHSRSVHVRCLRAGQFYAPKEDLAEVLTGPLARYSELPRLQVDGDGRLWLFFRHLQDLTPPGKRRVGNQLRLYQARGIWNPHVMYYADGEWSAPLKLPDSNGRNDMRLRSCVDAKGTVWATWCEDGRLPSRAEEPVNHNIHAATVRPATGASATLPVISLEPDVIPPVPHPEKPQSEPRYTTTVGETSYQLLYGDTHRHTDISRCGMNQDGSLIDTYRYAIDAAGLDFLAISDHDQDLLKHRYSRNQQGPLQDYAWWRSQKYCDLFYVKDRFLPIYGYEHGGSFTQRGGHKNVMYLERGNPCFEEDSPEELFNVLRGIDAVVIPHQLADGGSATNWGKWNAEFERVAEIFQVRGAYEFFGGPLPPAVQREGHYLRDALGGGVQIGVIASSDHGLVHGAYAGVYATEFSRRGILQALRERRSFGATEKMVIDFSLGDRMLGQEVELDDKPQFQIVTKGLQPLKLVEVIRDNRIVYSVQPDGREHRFQYTDMAPPATGPVYYYVRCQQENDEWAWSSAIWVSRKSGERE